MDITRQRRKSTHFFGGNGMGVWYKQDNINTMKSKVSACGGSKGKPAASPKK